jgi:hypothetical protein
MRRPNFSATGNVTCLRFHGLALRWRVRKLWQEARLRLARRLLEQVRAELHAEA